MGRQPLNFVVRRVMKDNKVNKEVALQSRLSFLRWASLKFISNESLVPNKVADMFWHAFLMFTIDYQSWCEQHFGDFFHHVPEDEESFEEIEQSLINNGEMAASCCVKCQRPPPADADDNESKDTEPKKGWIVASNLMFELYGDDWTETTNNQSGKGENEKGAYCNTCGNCGGLKDEEKKEKNRADCCTAKCSGESKKQKKEKAGCNGCDGKCSGELKKTEKG